MKIAIIYESKTNNTKLVAESIQAALVEDHEVVLQRVEDVTNLKDMDLLFLGSWTNKGSCGDSMKKLAESLNDKNIALFGTAGYGGTQEYFDNLAIRFSNEFNDSNTILGNFYSQGKMPDAIRDQYVTLLKDHPMDKAFEVNIENFDKAKSHPDENDLLNADEFAKKIVNSFDKI